MCHYNRTVIIIVHIQIYYSRCHISELTIVVCFLLDAFSFLFIYEVHKYTQIIMEIAVYNLALFRNCQFITSYKVTRKAVWCRY